MESVPGCGILDHFSKIAQESGLAFWQTRSNAVILHESVPDVCLEQVVNTKTEEILYQEASLSPHPPPRIILKGAWQVQHEDYNQRGTSVGRLVAVEGEVEPKIDFRIQGIPYAAVLARRRRSNTISQKIIASSLDSSEQRSMNRRFAE